ncbi:MAG TPA: FAD-dependent oxidoreductase [Solirubrobacteraceae bacterium]|nr:FAD-dependent oxidoreductase [Solirubrobacteraceae bacterium]
MPPLQRPERPLGVTLPARSATVAARPDVVVVGGGPAGIGAAAGAAQAGADVVLVERYGFLGGNATAALVMPLMSWHNEIRGARARGADEELRLLPSDHGPGKPVVAGVLLDLMERLLDRGGAIAPGEETGYTFPIDPEAYKSAALELLDAAGVRYLMHAFASGVTGAPRRPEGVVLETKSGPLVVQAPVIVDATGDGDVAVAAGADYEIGRDDGLVQPMTLMFRVVEFQREHFEGYVRGRPDQWRGVSGLWELVEQAREAGELDLPREDLLFFATPHEHELSVNSTRVSGVLGIDVFDLTRAERLARRQMEDIVRFLRKRVPGFEEAYAVQSGTQIGVRETRRITGEYRLTGDDVLRSRRFDDVIARGSYPIDIHDPKGGRGTLLERLPVGGAYDIPLRCLIPRDVDGLLVAGRCISGTHEAHSSYRVTPIALATGQAAGVAAALAAQGGVAPREVAADDVQRTLLAQGANLGDALAMR